MSEPGQHTYGPTEWYCRRPTWLNKPCPSLKMNEFHFSTGMDSTACGRIHVGTEIDLPGMIALFTCCRCCEWHQWCQSHVIHCCCNICCILTTQLLH